MAIVDRIAKLLRVIAPSRLFSFPNPVNERAARTVAAGVVLLCAAAIGLHQPWLLVPLCYGFWARVLTGPTLSPLGQLATRVVAPRLPGGRLVPGPPKRFAQAIGVAFSTTAVVLWLGFGLSTAGSVVTGLLGAAAFLESAFGLCLGCVAFGALMRTGVVPHEVCVACADLSLRRPDARRLGRRLSEPQIERRSGRGADGQRHPTAATARRRGRSTPSRTRGSPRPPCRQGPRRPPTARSGGRPVRGRRCARQGEPVPREGRGTAASRSPSSPRRPGAAGAHRQRARRPSPARASPLRGRARSAGGFDARRRAARVR